MYTNARLVASRWPVAASASVMSARYLIGDGIAQSADEKPHNLQRSLCFGLFGLVAGAGPYHWVYNLLYATRPFQRAGPLLTAAFDCAVMIPTWYFGSFYIFREAITTSGPGPSPSSSDNMIATTLKEARRKWKADYWDNTRMAFTIPFVQVVCSQKFVPPKLRSPFIGITGLAWVVLLSLFRGGGEEEDDGDNAEEKKGGEL